MSNPTSSDLLTAALTYAARGWRVVPLHTPATGGGCSCQRKCGRNIGKHPRTLNGLKDASTNPDQIVAWWDRWPEANVGIVTGHLSNLVVVDIDVRTAGDDTLRDLEAQNGALPPTIEAITGSGGRHLLFAHPGGKCPNSTGKLGPGIDTRGDGGYIVAAPSLHKSGGRYEWEISSDPSAVELAPMPDWLVSQLVTPDLATAGPTVNGTAAHAGAPLPVSKAALEFSIFGAAIGKQRDAAIRAARSFLAAGYSVEQTTDALWRGFQASPQDPAQLWTRADADKIAKDINSKPAPPPKPKQSQPPSPTTAANLIGSEHLTDIGNGRRLVARHGQDLRYCYEWGNWLVWDGARWRPDDTGEIYRRAKETVISIYGEVARAPNEATRRAISQHAQASEAMTRLRAMIAVAESEKGIAVPSAAFNADPWLFNVQNGTIDLHDGTLKPHDRNDLITHIANMTFEPLAECPQWTSFLRQTMAENENLVKFLQRGLGYSLSALLSEKALFVLYGPGGDNGKSTFLNAVLWLLGKGYAKPAKHDLLIAKQNESHPTELADLQGARFVATSEADEGKRLAVGLVKMLTGRDVLKARRMRQDFFDFEPTHKLWYATNHRPVIRGTDKAIWNRIKLIPFNVRFVGPDEVGPKADKQLESKLRTEAPGILNWLIAGCLEWQQLGLGAPDEVVAATNQYREDMDEVGDFLEACCLIAPNARVAKGAIYQRYAKWCQTSGYRPESHKVFSGRIQDRGIRDARSHGGVRLWVGIDLLPADTDVIPDADGDELVTGDKSTPQFLVNPHEKSKLSVIPEKGCQSVTGHHFEGDAPDEQSSGPSISAPKTGETAGKPLADTGRMRLDPTVVQELVDAGYPADLARELARADAAKHRVGSLVRRLSANGDRLGSEPERITRMWLTGSIVWAETESKRFAPVYQLEVEPPANAAQPTDLTSSEGET